MRQGLSVSRLKGGVNLFNLDVAYGLSNRLSL